MVLGVGFDGPNRRVSNDRAAQRRTGKLIAWAGQLSAQSRHLEQSCIPSSRCGSRPSGQISAHTVQSTPLSRKHLDPSTFGRNRRLGRLSSETRAPKGQNFEHHFRSTVSSSTSMSGNSRTPHDKICSPNSCTTAMTLANVNPNGQTRQKTGTRIPPH